MRNKVSIVGSGNVGATAAHWMAAKELADIVLVDIIDGVPQGKGLDLLEAMPIEKRDSNVLGTQDYADTANSDIVVITAGVPRKPGMSRDDLLNINHKIMSEVVNKVVKYSPNCLLIVVSNPLDAMAQAAYKMSGFSRNRVMGMAGILDSARFRAFIALELKVSVENVTAFVLGGHGDTMVPLPRYSTVAGIPITELMDKEPIERLVQRTRDGGAEIVKHPDSVYTYTARGNLVAVVSNPTTGLRLCSPIRCCATSWAAKPRPAAPSFPGGRAPTECVSFSNRCWRAG